MTEKTRGRIKALGPLRLEMERPRLMREEPLKSGLRGEDPDGESSSS